MYVPYRIGDATVANLNIMGLVNVNCPNCGASVQLSDEQNRAFCMFCGGQIQVQEAIQKVRIDKSGELENLLMLIKGDLEASDFETAEKRVQKALEIDATNPEIWLLNMYASSGTTFGKNGEMLTDIIIGNGTAYTSTMRSGDNAIKYSNNDIQYRKKVNDCYLLHCVVNLVNARDYYGDVQWVNARLQELEELCYPGQIAHWGQHEHEDIMCSEDAENIGTISSWEVIAFDFLDKVDVEILDDKHYDNLVTYADVFKNSTDALNRRFGLYNTNISDEHLQWRQNQLNKIYNMIPKSYLESKAVVGAELSNEKQSETNWGKLIWSIILFILVMLGFFLSQMEY